MSRATRRAAFSLVELLVVIGVSLVAAGLAMPAAQRARDASYRTACANNLRQIGLALHNYHDLYKAFPPGCTSYGSGDPYPFLSWQTRLLPFLDQEAVWDQTVQAYALDRNFSDNPPHVGLATVLPMFTCPADGRTSEAQKTRGYLVAFTSYLGVEGQSVDRTDGVFYLDSHVRMSDITDGTSNTLMAGERPPSADLFYGWWYAGQGQAVTGSCDEFLGVREINIAGPSFFGCMNGPYRYDIGQAKNQCDQFHFWSLHMEGAHFLFADGSNRFLAYDADAVMPALASRNGGEDPQIP
jgi:prepilin-type processing-associated H-X9-DG protein